MRCLSPLKAITVGGLTPPSAVLTDSVCWVVVSCAPRKVDVMCLYWPLMVDALLCGRLIQLMDGDLGTNAHDCGCGNDNGCDVFGHGWCEVNATECGNNWAGDCTLPTALTDQLLRTMRSFGSALQAEEICLGVAASQI